MARPLKYRVAQSLDEALHAVLTGQAPVKPRNEFERAAARSRPGRKVNTASATRIALELARFFLKENPSRRLAARMAVDALATQGGGMLNADNIRKLLGDKSIRVTHRTWAGQVERQVPFIVSMGVSGEIDTPEG
jgi:hypothetical protein